jgi:hypothetical protein
VVEAPKDRGGLGIKDPILMNLAIGSDLVCRLISCGPKRWKIILWRNYFSGNQKHCIEGQHENQRGSHIWRVLKATILIICSNLTWIPRNEKEIQI